MNLLDFRKTSPQQAYDAVARLAAERGVEVLESELIGLVPRGAVDLSFAQATRCRNFTSEAVIETRLESARSPLDSPAEFLDALAGKHPVPGGGSAAALAGAMGAALVAMLANLTIGRKKFEAAGPRMEAIRARAESIRGELFSLVRRDTEAYAAVMEAYRLSKDDPGRPAAVQRALRGAAEPPMRVAELCAEVCELSAEAVALGNPNALTDGGGGALLAEAACVLAADNVRTNLAGLDDLEFGGGARRRLDELLARARLGLGRVRAALAAALPE
jgi:formiminotetrahydrofolate cyclodeaminase